MKKPLSKYITAIDIGTTKICVIIASVDMAGKLDILGLGHHPSFGLSKGVVVNIMLTADSIKKALHEAESMAGVEVESACVGISGGHIQSRNSNGVVNIKGNEVTQHDIDRAIDAARAVPLPDDQDVLHVIPQYFRVDDQEPVSDSIGMYGTRLEVQVHMVTGAIASARNIIKSCDLAGVKVSDIVLEQLASADAVLTKSERSLGIGILDIGGGTSDFALYKNGCIKHSKVIPVAGNHFTNDISLCCGIPFERAEDLKRRHGSILPQRIKSLTAEYIDVPLGYEGGVKSLSLASIGTILHCRADELCDLVIDELLQFNLQHSMPAGLVITGGGSLLGGVVQLFSQRLGITVRVGAPESMEGDVVKEFPDLLKSPVYATAYGLVKYVLGDRYGSSFSVDHGVVLTRLFKRMQSWIYNFF